MVDIIVMKESSSNLESSVHMFRQNRNGSNIGGNVVFENNLKRNGIGASGIGHGVDVLSGSELAGIHLTRNHLVPDIIVSNKGGVANRGKSMMHTSATTMDIKSLQKSNTFSSSLSSGGLKSNTFSSSLSSGGLKLGSWFDRRARKISMKCSKSMTLGKKILINLCYRDTLLPPA